MLYQFLVHHRNLNYASRKLYFHADNCVGQNKNNALIHLYRRCVANAYAYHIELKFLLKGHTKFSEVRGFGLIKKHYRNTNTYTIEQIAEKIEKSTQETRRNRAIILEKNDFGSFQSALQHFFRTDKRITDFSVFLFDKEYPLGEVRVRKHGDDKFIRCNLLNPKLQTDQILNNKTFTLLQEKLQPIDPPQMSAEKQWDLYEKVRPYGDC